MSTSKIIDSLDTAARAAGFAMAGSDDATTIQHDHSAGQTTTATPGEQAQGWLRQMGNLKNPLPSMTGWTPWKATA